MLDKRPRLFVLGSRDKIVQPDELQKLVSQMHEPARLQTIQGPGHDLKGYEPDVADAVAAFLGEALHR
jgi:pimeloyl-ACP methyl ester carboxylesterase